MNEIEDIVNRIMKKEISIDDLTEDGKKAVVKYLEKTDKRLQKHLANLKKQTLKYQKNTKKIQMACDKLDEKMEVE